MSLYAVQSFLVILLCFAFSLNAINIIVDSNLKRSFQQDEDFDRYFFDSQNNVWLNKTQWLDRNFDVNVREILWTDPEVYQIDALFFAEFGQNLSAIEFVDAFLEGDFDCGTLYYDMEFIVEQGHLWLNFWPANDLENCNAYLFDQRRDERNMAFGFFRQVALDTPLINGDFILSIGEVSFEEVLEAIELFYGMDGRYDILDNNCAQKLMQVMYHLEYPVSDDLKEFVLDALKVQGEDVVTLLRRDANLRNLFPNETLAEARSRSDEEILWGVIVRSGQDYIENSSGLLLLSMMIALVFLF